MDVAGFVGAVIGALIFGLIIWIIGKLNLGIQLKNYWWAVTLGILISAFTNFLHVLVPDTNAIISGILGIVVTALVITVSANRLKGIQSRGFAGALVAAISI